LHDDIQSRATTITLTDYAESITQSADFDRPIVCRMARNGMPKKPGGFAHSPEPTVATASLRQGLEQEPDQNSMSTKQDVAAGAVHWAAVDHGRISFLGFTW
jgi:hypothetical protein